jgi:hypothetical protein
VLIQVITTKNPVSANVLGGLTKLVLKINISIIKVARVCVRNLARIVRSLKFGIQNRAIANVQKKFLVKLIDIGTSGRVSANANKRQEIVVLS